MPEFSSRRVLSRQPAASTTTRAFTWRLAARMPVDEMRSVGEAGLFVDGDLADDRVRDQIELPGRERIRQQQVDRAGQAVRPP